MALSKFFRVALEGDTTDGRKIERSWIEQMAKGYDRAKYGARIWMEHLRGIMPDGPFKAYGDVVALKTEEVTIDGQKKLALLAQIDATPDLVAMNKARQKIYSSIEVDPNFARSGQAYLAGLGVTDSPASLGTEMLSFAAGAAANPLSARKQNPDNLFGAAQEVALEFEEETKPSVGESLFSRVKELLSGKAKDDAGHFADIRQAVEAIATSQKEALEKFATFSKTLDDTTKTLQSFTASQAEDRAALATLREQFDKAPDGSPQRPPATGGNGNAKVTDC